MNTRYSTYHTLFGYHACMHNRTLFHTAFGWAFHIQKRAHTRRRLAGFAYTSATTPAARTLEQTAVQALPGSRRGRRARWRKKRTKSPPQVEKRITKRGERSFLPSFNDTILHFIRFSYTSGTAQSWNRKIWLLHFVGQKKTWYWNFVKSGRCGAESNKYFFGAAPRHDE